MLISIAWRVIQRLTFIQLHIFCWTHCQSDWQIYQILQLLLPWLSSTTEFWWAPSFSGSKYQFQVLLLFVVWVSVSHICHVILQPAPAEVWQIRLFGSQVSVSMHCHLVVIFEQLMSHKQQRYPALTHYLSVNFIGSFQTCTPFHYSGSIWICWPKDHPGHFSVVSYNSCFTRSELITFIYHC